MVVCTIKVRENPVFVLITSWSLELPSTHLIIENRGSRVTDGRRGVDHKNKHHKHHSLCLCAYEILIEISTYKYIVFG
jgi:hypothetical protein